MKHVLAAGLALALAMLAVAPATFAGGQFLPDETQALIAIDELPAVRAALAREHEAAARGDALRQSPYGLELTMMPLARHTRDRSYGEIESMLTKRLRLPAKGRLDDALASTGSDIAHYSLGDARHAGARLLLDAWCAWARAAGAARLTGQQRDTLAAEHRAVSRRASLGDLPLLDEQRSAAALAHAELAVERARIELEQTRLTVAVQFPSLNLPVRAPSVPAPSLNGAIDAATAEEIVAHSHELQLALAATRRQALAAARADAERHPDPSLGLRVLSEGGGSDQAIGIVMIIPFAAGGSAATVRAERALDDAINTEATGIARMVRLDADKLLAARPAQLSAWQAAMRARKLTEEALGRIDKSWRLGATDFSELAAARRLAHEAAATELDLRLDVHALQARIEIDSHRRWAGDTGHNALAPDQAAVNEES